MAVVIETVNIEDVYPLVDEFGNDIASRDYTRKENIAYVDELARSMKSKGVPDEMVTLVRDGGIYRIKAGNSRVMAMRKLGTKSFPAIVEDTSTEQAIIETTVRTNTKKKYEDIEECRFIRQLALFGNDEYVSEVSGIEPAKVAKVRKAAKLVDDAADDMSLLRLIAIGEFADDSEAVEALTNCTEKDFPRIESELKHGREIAEQSKAIEDVLAKMGIEVVYEYPSGRYVCTVASVDDIPDDLHDECVAVHRSGAHFYIYDISVEDDQETAKREMIKSLYSDVAKERRAWLASHIADDMPTLVEHQQSSPYNYRVGGFLNDESIELPKTPADTIQTFVELELESSLGYLYGNHLETKVDNFKELGKILEEYGYEPSPDEKELIRLVDDYMGGVQ